MHGQRAISSIKPRETNTQWFPRSEQSIILAHYDQSCSWSRTLSTLLKTLTDQLSQHARSEAVHVHCLKISIIIIELVDSITRDIIHYKWFGQHIWYTILLYNAHAHNVIVMLKSSQWHSMPPLSESYKPVYCWQYLLRSGAAALAILDQRVIQASILLVCHCTIDNKIHI